jgi:hypothetical protein
MAFLDFALMPVSMINEGFKKGWPLKPWQVGVLDLGLDMLGLLVVSHFIMAGEQGSFQKVKMKGY